MAKREQSVVAKEARTRSVAELRSLLTQKKEALQKLRFKKEIGQLKKTDELGFLKRDMARLNTVLGEMAKAGAK